MKKIFLFIFLSLFLYTQTKGQSVEPFKKGDRVVFAGNSITEAGFYESYIWLYYMTRFPEMRIDVFNGGVGGDVAKQIYLRFDGDFLPKKPTVMAITFGRNDSRYFEYKTPGAAEKVTKEAVQQSFESFLLIQDRFRKMPDVRKIIMTTSPYDETMIFKDSVKNASNYFPGKSVTIEKIAQFQEKAAKDNNWEFVDMLRPMTEINVRNQKINPEFTLTGPDRIHPGNAGHLVMASLFLKAQGFQGKPVAEIKINASKKKVLKSENCTISNLKTSRKSISFDYLAKSLPFPIDTIARVWMNPHKQSEALDIIPFTNDFNKEMLIVKGLKGKSYNVKIDDKTIGTWTALDLAKGLNLATIPSTPQNIQAAEIMNLNQQRYDIESKFRAYFWIQYNFLNEKGLLFDDSEAVKAQVFATDNPFVRGKKGDYEQIRIKSSREELQLKMDNLIKLIYEKNIPTIHRIKLEKSK